MNYFKPISISLSPNVEKDDLHLALNLIIRPWLWTRQKLTQLGGQEKESTVQQLEKEFKEYLGVKYAISFNSGRSSLYAILKALSEVEGFKPGTEVLLQAFTCNAVPNPILWAGLEPIYVDCNKEDFNIDVSDLEAKITSKTHAVIVQHTFGLPANMDAIRAICGAYNLILIEDCAHSLGAEYGGLKVGAHSKVAFFSFGRDKVISSVYGGMVVTNDDELAKKIKQEQDDFGIPNSWWIFQQILHPILLGYIILPLYNFLDLGKIFLVFSQWFHILSKAVVKKEKTGQKPDYFPKALPNALAIMALNQFFKLEKFNAHRQKIAEYYYKELQNDKFQLPKRYEGASAKASATRRNIFLRFAVQHKNANEIIHQAWHKQNILLGDWYTTPIAPFDTNVTEMKYAPGSCKNAEELAKNTFNLPTHINISKKEVDRIINFLKSWK